MEGRAWRVSGLFVFRGLPDWNDAAFTKERKEVRFRRFPRPPSRVLGLRHVQDLLPEVQVLPLSGGLKTPLQATPWTGRVRLLRDGHGMASVVLPGTQGIGFKDNNGLATRWPPANHGERTRLRGCRVLLSWW